MSDVHATLSVVLSVGDTNSELKYRMFVFEGPSTSQQRASVDGRTQANRTSNREFRDILGVNWLLTHDSFWYWIAVGMMRHVYPYFSIDVSGFGPPAFDVATKSSIPNRKRKYWSQKNSCFIQCWMSMWSQQTHNLNMALCWDVEGLSDMKKQHLSLLLVSLTNNTTDRWMWTLDIGQTAVFFSS